MRISAVSLFMPTPYTKPYLDERQHVALLKSRGLLVADEAAAAEFLSRVNYYRLSGYAIPFLLDRERFLDGAEFDELLAVYRFDRVLRDLLSEALEAAELAYRTILARKWSKLSGPLGYRDPQNFRNPSQFESQMRHFDKTVSDSNEPCIVHIREAYGVTQVPIWALVEVETFGPLTRLFENANAELQGAVADEFEIRPYPLKSYLQHLRVLRNFCAHHARLFGRKFYGYRPFVEWLERDVPVCTSRLFAQFLFVYRMLRGMPSVCFDRDEWRSRVVRSFESAPTVKVFDIRRVLGAPKELADSALWL